MDKKTDIIVIQLLKSRLNVDEKRLQAYFSEAEKKQISPIPLIAQYANVPESDLLAMIAAELHIEYCDLKQTVIDKPLIGKVPVKIAAYYQFVPVSLDNRVLTIVVAYPLEIKKLDEIRTHMGYSIKMSLGCEADVADMVKKYYGLGAATLDKIMTEKNYESSQAANREQQGGVADLEERGESASVIQLVNQIILEAYKKRATDIHVEPYRSKLRLRYRIDGILYDANVSPELGNFLTPILSRIKLMANLNIVERRVPQDGRAIVKVQGETLDLRVSFIPTPHGESVVIRILPTVMLFGLDKLGLTDTELEFFRGLINKPHGIIFVTGPTGSGKTTTLYACLSTINTSERKIITIEDPIEYELEGVTQIQITPEVGLDFARGLRSMLRHDPDVMMVGEVRDLETAEIAIRVALTGHLVFSTLHTNDAASGITRLIDIGLEPYLVASSVDAFIAQRLIRVNCPHCNEEDKQVLDSVKEQIARELGQDNPLAMTLYRGKGCQACNFTGYFGRTAIHEILLLDEGIKKLTSQKSSSDQIKKHAVNQGMRTLRQSGWVKVLQGITTPDEILRVTQSDELPPVSPALEPEPVKPVAASIPPAPAELSAAAAPQKTTTPSVSDRRIYERIEGSIYVRFKIFRTKTPDNAQRAFEPEIMAVTKNISAGGVLFSSSEYIAPGKILDLAVMLTDEEKNIACLARVVRCTELVPNKDFEIAACFLDLSNAERNRLNRYLERSRK